MRSRRPDPGGQPNLGVPALVPAAGMAAAGARPCAMLEQSTPRLGPAVSWRAPASPLDGSWGPRRRAHSRAGSPAQGLHCREGCAGGACMALQLRLHGRQPSPALSIFRRQSMPTLGLPRDVRAAGGSCPGRPRPAAVSVWQGAGVASQGIWVRPCLRWVRWRLCAGPGAADPLRGHAAVRKEQH